MSIMSTLFLKIWHVLLSFLRLLRRAVCCRRKRHDADMLLPMTTNQLRYESPGPIGYPSNQDPEFQNWEVWNENEQTTTVGVECEQRRLSNGAVAMMRSTSRDSNEEHEDFFADMVPQFKKPKKLLVRNPDENSSSASTGYSNRLSMDPRVPPMQGAELGVLEDNPSSWEESELLEELWDPDSLIREKRMAEREKRLAEHQRRKLEKESRRLSKQDISLASKLS